MVKPVSVSLHSCRKIFVERDYSHGLHVRFVKSFPASLEGIIRREDWEETINTINEEFATAEKVCFGSLIETLLGLFTCYISRLFLPTRYEKQLKKIRSYIRVQNRNVFLPVGILMSDPMEKGLRVIEVNIISTGRIVSSSSPANNSTTIAVEEV